MRRYLRILPVFIYARLVRRYGEYMYIGGYGYFYDGHGLLIPALTKATTNERTKNADQA